MCRITSGVTTESHPLYATFMAQLSQCIFEWSDEDLKLLKKAKAAELAASSIRYPSDTDVAKRLSKHELSLHVQRRTRGVDTTIRMIKELLAEFTKPQGTDTLGVPLLDLDRISEIWESQRRHVSCLQDPNPALGVALYTQVGTIIKGGVQLPVYRCARGSTSLDSFNKHLNAFILGR